MVCRDNKGHMFASSSKKIEDVPVLVTEAIAIREALRTTCDRNMDKILIESDAKIVINSTRGLITVSSHIMNHVIYIINLGKNIDNIQFSYCNKSLNFLADRMVERSRCACINHYLHQ